MMHRFLSPLSHRRFFALFRHDLFELRKLHDINAAFEQQWRFVSNAAVREIPDNVKAKKKIVPSNQRRQLIEAYVNQYRVMNAGKFPGVKNVQKHVGGGYYKVRAILQEYEYSCKLTDGKTVPLNGKSNYQLQHDESADVEDRGISVGVDKGNCEIIDDESTPNKDHEIITGSVSGCGRKVDLENGEASDKVFADVDMSDKVNSLEIPGVPVTLSLLENSLANETSMALATDDPTFQAKSSHHPEVTGTTRNLEPEEIDKSADHAFESDQFTRVMDVGELSTVLNEKTQIGDFYNKISSITQELDNSTMGDEIKRKGRITSMNDYQVPTDNNSRNQEADNCSFREMIGESILTQKKEVRTDIYEKQKMVDVKLKREDHKASNTNVGGDDYIGSRETEELLQQPSSMLDTSEVILKATTIENNAHSAKAQNSDIVEKGASHQASKSGGISWGTTVQQTTDKESQESSLWGNVKLLASNIMSFWRKK